jgi:hypothetical protein
VLCIRVSVLMVPRDALATLAIFMVRRRLRGRAGLTEIRNALLGNARQVLQTCVAAWRLLLPVLPMISHRHMVVVKVQPHGACPALLNLTSLDAAVPPCESG